MEYISQALWEIMTAWEDYYKNKVPYTHKQIQAARHIILQNAQNNECKQAIQNRRNNGWHTNTINNNKHNAIYQEREWLKSKRKQITTGVDEYKQRKEYHDNVINFLHKHIPEHKHKTIWIHMSSMQKFLAGIQSHQLLDLISDIVENSLQPPIKNL
jgi:hypothetical protein